MSVPSRRGCQDPKEAVSQNSSLDYPSKLGRRQGSPVQQPCSLFSGLPLIPLQGSPASGLFKPNNSNLGRLFLFNSPWAWVPPRAINGFLSSREGREAVRVEAETYDLGQGTAVVESELGPCGKSDLKPCSDLGNSFSLTRAAWQRLDANPWVRLPASCPLPFFPASSVTSLRLCFTWVLGQLKPLGVAEAGPTDRCWQEG